MIKQLLKPQASNKNTAQAEQHCFLVLFGSDPDTNTVFPSLIPPGSAGPGSEEAIVFLLMILYISPKIIWKAFSTLVASSAEVSMKERPSFSAKFWASSEATARRCSRSVLLPISMITMFESAWSRSSLSHRLIFSKLVGLVTS